MPASIERLIDIKTVYVEPGVADFARGKEILEQHSDAEIIEVPSHNNIPGLYGNEGNVRNWIHNKRSVLILGVKKSLTARRNERSSNWIAPSTANGCAMSCSYCYVPRRKGFANPITTFVNIEQIVGYLERHAGRQGMKLEPDQCDPALWVYDIGENSDVSVDAAVSDNVRDLVHLFSGLPNAKASFATKWVNRDLLTYDPQGHTRVRFSLMPHDIATKVDLRTSRIAERIGAINDFVEAGYEVHLNFSPVIITNDWHSEWSELFEQIDDELSPAAKAQLACEIIFLTHNEALHDINMGWHPRGEDVLWRPELQQKKLSQNGMWNVRYNALHKKRYISELLELMDAKLPYCRVRYAF